MTDKSGRESPATVLIMGIGNSLLQDDGVGVLVTERVRETLADDPRIRCLDGGTLGLSLLPDIETSSCLIVVDASELGARPGSIRIFRNEEMDRQLSGRKTTVHEVALADLMAAAAMSGRQPSQRVLVAIQPAATEWGLQPTPEVRDCVPEACSVVEAMARELAA
jgi:hydrogenase maturation protease